MKRIIASLAALLCLSTTAYATVYSPTLSEMLSYSLLGADNSTVSVNPAAIPYDNGVGGAEFSVVLTPTTDHFGWALFGKNYSNLDLSSYDSFQLKIDNNNENPWNFQLYLYDNDTASSLHSLPATLIADGSSDTLKIDFASNPLFNFSGIDQVGLFVFEDLPIIDELGRKDFTAEFSLSPVPEPGTFALLGAGLVALPFIRKRMKK